MILLSAALDLVGPDVPKGVVLLADIVPSFTTKLIAPYFIHVVPYSTRVLGFIALSILGMAVVAISPSYDEGGVIAPKIVGIILASVSSGAGELSFVGLTHFYGPFSLAAWGSGTGAAGLVGAGAYALLTSAIGVSVRGTLFASACLPLIMAVSFFGVLPRGPLRTPQNVTDRYFAVETGDGQPNEEEEEGLEVDQGESEGLLGDSVHSRQSQKSTDNDAELQWMGRVEKNLSRVKKLFLPL